MKDNSPFKQFNPEWQNQRFRDTTMDCKIIFPEENPLPFRPEVPVYRVVLGRWDIQRFHKCSLYGSGCFLPEYNFQNNEQKPLYWYCYRVSLSERKSKRV